MNWLVINFTAMSLSISSAELFANDAMKSTWRTRCLLFVVATIPLPAGVFASTDTIGDNGIMSIGLRTFNGMPLNGAGVSIGQVEDYRPTKPGFDTDSELLNSFINPSQVYWRNVHLIFGNTLVGLTSKIHATYRQSSVKNCEICLPSDSEGDRVHKYHDGLNT